MFRDTLEMIPVAIIMTLILSFGMKTGRAPALSSRPVPLALQASGAEPSRPTPGVSTSRTSEAENESLSGTEASREDEAAATSDLAPRLFIERIPARNGVPFYTSQDIAAFQREHGRSNVAKREGPSADVGVDRRAAARDGNRRIALNRATLGELKSIPGVGPVKAQALIMQRPRDGYKSWPEIDRVPGIGAGMIATMQLHATLD